MIYNYFNDVTVRTRFPSVKHRMLLSIVISNLSPSSNGYTSSTTEVRHTWLLFSKLIKCCSMRLKD